MVTGDLQQSLKENVSYLMSIGSFDLHSINTLENRGFCSSPSWIIMSRAPDNYGSIRERDKR